ncbi:DNA/RNA non-specific endonuclease [Pediococcus cellicola]|uniref:Prophage Lp1 protein 65 n=1 Tax=Pediococcus cellicola TaxID=319652 RepID=A0A0R2IZA9_9LACO|nr:DNA/RNA non-specific endonuclease [Pediococcus cellicola]KRN67367.1 prophage Lp1 protein 65 [Pediococcus cellicola]GEL15919.1 DNA-entry nuclease [Pediococcus cellicola]
MFIGIIFLIIALFAIIVAFRQRKDRIWFILLAVITLFLSWNQAGTYARHRAFHRENINSTKVITKVNSSAKKLATSLKTKNSHLATGLSSKSASLKKKAGKLHMAIAQYQSKASQTRTQSTDQSQLANKTFSGQQTILVNQNQPDFTSRDLATTRGAWQTYGNLDHYNRVTAANALLNKRLMPTQAREELDVDPTGWHNKKTANGWLYNRCHLIGYQLTGQNNNAKNLMTGTRSLNDPEMTVYENKVADYLKASKTHYVRYRVTPIFRGSELVARGIQMEGQSIGSNAIHFNVYIFNVESGYTINYQTGTSVKK